MTDTPAESKPEVAGKKVKAKPEKWTKCTVSLAKAVHDGLVRRGVKATSRGIAKIIETEMGIPVVARTIGRWMKAGWPEDVVKGKRGYHRPDPVKRIAAALEEAVAKTNTIPKELLRELDDLLSDDEELAAAILGVAGYQAEEGEKLEKLIGDKQDAAEETMGKMPPNPVDITTPRLLLKNLIDETKYPDHELMRLAQRELYISVMLGAREVSRRREFLTLTYPKELGELYKSMASALEAASTTVLDLAKINEYAKQIIKASEKGVVTVYPPGANGNGAVPHVSEDDDLSRAFKEYEKVGKGNGH